MNKSINWTTLLPGRQGADAVRHGRDPIERSRTVVRAIPSGGRAESGRASRWNGGRACRQSQSRGPAFRHLRRGIGHHAARLRRGGRLRRLQRVMHRLIGRYRRSERRKSPTSLNTARHFVVFFISSCERCIVCVNSRSTVRVNVRTGVKVSGRFRRVQRVEVIASSRQLRRINNKSLLSPGAQHDTTRICC